MREISRFLLIFAKAQKAMGVLESSWRQGSGNQIGLWTKISRLYESNDLCLEVAHGLLKKWIKLSYRRNRDSERLVIFKQ